MKEKGGRKSKEEKRRRKEKEKGRENRLYSNFSPHYGTIVDF